MTDLDRLKQISAAAGTGLPPPTNEERRFLLKQLADTLDAFADFAQSKGVFGTHEARALADACRYTIPPKRCIRCDGTGDIGYASCYACHGTGYQEPVT